SYEQNRCDAPSTSQVIAALRQIRKARNPWPLLQGLDEVTEKHLTSGLSALPRRADDPPFAYLGLWRLEAILASPGKLALRDMLHKGVGQALAVIGSPKKGRRQTEPARLVTSAEIQRIWAHFTGKRLRRIIDPMTGLEIGAAAMFFNRVMQ